MIALVLMASRPHRLTDTVCGRVPLFAALCDARMESATAAPRCSAAAPGILYGSSAWMLRPAPRATSDVSETTAQRTADDRTGALQAMAPAGGPSRSRQHRSCCDQYVSRGLNVIKDAP